MRKISRTLALVLMSKRTELRPVQRVVTLTQRLEPKPELSMKTAALVQRMKQTMSQEKFRPVQMM